MGWFKGSITIDYTSISDDGCLTTSGATPYSIGRIFFMRAKIELVSSIPKLHEKTSLKGRVHYNLEHKVVDSCHWLATNWVLSAKLSGQREEYLLSTSFVADFLLEMNLNEWLNLDWRLFFLYQ